MLTSSYSYSLDALIFLLIVGWCNAHKSIRLVLKHPRYVLLSLYLGLSVQR